jgi:hypothetical protein
MKKVNLCRFGSGKWFFSFLFGEFCESRNKLSKTVQLSEEYNKYYLTADLCF